MRKTIGLLAALAIIASIPSNAQAQRGRNGPVTTPFGQYNMNEWLSSGGNPFAAEAMREQKMMMQQQQQMMKMQQQYMQQMARQKKTQDDFKKNPDATKSSTTAARTTTAKTKKKAATKSTALAKGTKTDELEATTTPANVPGAPSTSKAKTAK